MSALTEAYSAFQTLVKDIGKQLTLSDVRYMKYLLKGHVNKETLQNIDSGQELIEVLRKSGLVSERKLAFMRKLLIEAKCLKQVNLVDEFKEKFTAVAVAGEWLQTERNSKLSNKRETLLRMIEKLENESRACEEADTEFTNQIKEFEMQIKANNENLVSVEDILQNLKKKVLEQEGELQSLDSKLETTRFLIKKRQVDIDKIKQKLEENHSNVKITRELREKQDEYEISKKNEDELNTKRQTVLNLIRTLHVEIRHKTQDLISLEDNIHDLLMQTRVLKQRARKNHHSSAELQEQLENLSRELEDTRCLKPLTPYSMIRTPLSLHGSLDNEPQLSRKLEYKILDYDEITGCDAIAIGRKGKRVNPPRFQFPMSVAADMLGNVYVADYGNARIQILDFKGQVAREPLPLGGKCRPCALAVSFRGDLLMTDSQILRLFSKTGEPIRPILPVYRKNDKRPEISAVAFDMKENVYASDKANHRIQKFTFQGNFLCFIGSPHELHCPMGLTVKTNGDVIVSEFENHRIKIFSQENSGEITIIGRVGVGAGKFSCPRGVALDQDENILVADSHNHRIQAFSSTGESLGAFGMIGSDPGCLDTPYDVFMLSNGNIIVADAKNHRVQVFMRLMPVYAEPDTFNEDYETAATDSEDPNAERGTIRQQQTDDNS